MTKSGVLRSSTEKPREPSPGGKIGDEKHSPKPDNPVPEENAPRSEDVTEGTEGSAAGGQRDATGSLATPRSASPTQPSAGNDSPPDVEIIPAPATKKSKSKGESSRAAPPQVPAAAPAPVIDVRWEASKLPLDVAIFNSARAAGGVDRIKKFLQVVVIVGGTSMIPGMVHALESRSVVFLSELYLARALVMGPTSPTLDQKWRA